MEKPSKRRTLFVDPKLQSALAVRLVVHWGLFAVVLAVLTMSLKFFANPFQSYSELTNSFLREQWPVLMTMTLLLPLFVYDSLKLSNRFAGPIIRFRKQIVEIADGAELKQLKFRKGDFWHDLANDFNRMLQRFDSPAATEPNSTPPTVGKHDAEELDTAPAATPNA